MVINGWFCLCLLMYISLTLGKILGRLPSNTRKYQIKSLQERHKEVLRRLSLGQAPKTIAGDLGVTTSVVHYVKNSTLGKCELSLLQEGRNGSAMDITNQIKEMSPEALETLEDIMNNEDSADAVRAKVAMDLLDRAGHGAVKKQLSMSGTLSQDDVENIKKRALAIASENGTIVEAEVVSEQV